MTPIRLAISKEPIAINWQLAIGNSLLIDNSLLFIADRRGA